MADLPKPHSVDHRHETLRTSEFIGCRRQTDEVCGIGFCEGVGRVQSEYAPDIGRNWLRCCCCGRRWV